VSPERCLRVDSSSSVGCVLSVDDNLSIGKDSIGIALNGKKHTGGGRTKRRKMTGRYFSRTLKRSVGSLAEVKSELFANDKLKNGISNESGVNA
jgi:hypothetical protein